MMVEILDEPIEKPPLKLSQVNRVGGLSGGESEMEIKKMIRHRWLKSLH